MWHPLRDRRAPDPLDRVDAFADLDARRRRPLARHTDRLALDAGAVVARRGATAHEAVVVLAGELVEVGDGPVAHGDERRALGPGAVVGGAAVLDGERHAVTIAARTPVELLVVGAPALRSVARDSSALEHRLRGVA